MPLDRRRTTLRWTLGSTGVLALAAAYLASTGAAGMLLFLLLTLGVGIIGLLAAALGRGWRARRLAGRVLRGCCLGLLLVAAAFLLVYGNVTIIRFAVDRGALPIPDRYVCVIIADGASLLQARDLVMHGVDDPTQYATALNRNFPNISRHFLLQGAFTANGIAVWPSSSIPAHTGIMTGAYPRTSGVMGQRQFDTVHRKYTSYIGLGILSQRKVMEQRVKTLYEYFPDVRSVDVLQVVNRGCSLYVPSTPEDEIVTARACQVIEYTAFLGRLTGRAEIPRLLVITLPGIDHLTHNSLLSAEKALRAYLDTDRHVGEIMAVYRHAGIFKKTLFVLAADHGMGEVTNHVTLDNLMHDMRFDTYQSLKWSVVPAWGSFEANTFVGTRRRFDNVYNALPLWGGNSDALLYIKGQRGDHGERWASWDLRPAETDLHRYRVGGTTIDVIGRLLEYSPGIGLIFTNPERNVFNVYARDGQGQIRERQQAGRLQFQYHVVRGRDPLGYLENPRLAPVILGGVWLDDRQWLRLTYLEHYPDALRRIAYSLQHRNSANLHIVATDGWDFTPYYVAKRVLVGSHGSLNDQHSLVPIMFYGPGIAKRELPYGRTVDILPTILAYLGQPCGHIDGRPLPVFTDPAKTAAAAAPMEETSILKGRYRYVLQGRHASYDQLLARIDTRTGAETVLIDNLQQAFPDQLNRLNVVAELLGIDGSSLILRQRYLGEKREGRMFRVMVR